MRSTTQIWVVMRACFSDVISWGNQRWYCEMSAVFSGYKINNPGCAPLTKLEPPLNLATSSVLPHFLKIVQNVTKKCFSFMSWFFKLCLYYLPFFYLNYNRKSRGFFSLQIVTDFQLHSNWENHEHQKYFWNVIVLQEKSQSGIRRLNRKQEHLFNILVCGFVASSHILMFAVIGRNKINIPEIF